MTTRIEKDFYFQTAVHFEDKFYINSYDLTISVLVETDSIREQNVAMDRASHFLMSVMQNSILINSKETDVIEKYKNAGLKICEFPEDPYDQILSMVILQKLNAIMEGRLRVTDLVVGSTMSEGVRFTMVSEVAENVLGGNYWWNKPTICLNNTEASTNKTNIVKLFDDTHWVDLGLSWKEKGKK